MEALAETARRKTANTTQIRIVVEVATTAAQAQSQAISAAATKRKNLAAAVARSAQRRAFDAAIASAQANTRRKAFNAAVAASNQNQQERAAANKQARFEAKAKQINSAAAPASARQNDQDPIGQPQKSQSTPNKPNPSPKTTAKLPQISKIPGVSRNAARGQNSDQADIKMMPTVPTATIKQTETGALFKIETTTKNKGCQPSKGGDDKSRTS